MARLNPTAAQTPPIAGRWVVCCLAVTVGLTCCGAGLWSAASETPVFEVLLFNWEWPEAIAERVDQAASYLNWAAAAALFLASAAWAWRAPGGRLGRSILRVALAASVFCFAWQSILAAGAWLREENFRPRTSWGPLEDWLGNGQIFGEVAVRVAAPAALAAWLAAGDLSLSLSLRSARRLIWLLRGAAALTFAVHGYEALRSNARFVDLLLAADQRLLAGGLSEAGARRILLVIGWIDLLLAALIVAVRWRWVAGYMALWGLLTAVSRMTHSGWQGGWETLLRAANCGVPLAICLYWSATRPFPPEDPPHGP